MFDLCAKPTYLPLLRCSLLFAIHHLIDLPASCFTRGCAPILTANMSTMDSLQPPSSLDYCQRDSEMSSVEMYPSSAVAQTHVPGSAAHIGTLQQPPPSANAASLHHHRTTSILQNPSFDNKHGAYRSADVSVSVSVNKVANTTQQLHPHSNGATASAMERTITSTNTATNSAMMIDDPVNAANNGVAGKGSTQAGGNSNGDGKNVEAKQPGAETGAADATDDAGNNSAVRKVR